MKKLCLIIFSVILIISLNLTLFSANAQTLDKAYLQAEFWNGHDGVKSKSYNFNDGMIEGVLRCKIDTINNAVYFRNDFASSMDLDLLKLHFDVYNENHEYHFAIDKNGMCDNDGNEDFAFEIIYNFDLSQMIGIRIIDGSLINNLTLTIYYQGRNYIVEKDIYIDATTVEDVSESTSTAIAKTETTTKLKNPTTKLNKQTTQKQSTTKKLSTTKEITTKYIPKSHKFIQNETSKTITKKYSSDESGIVNKEIVENPTTALQSSTIANQSSKEIYVKSNVKPTSDNRKLIGIIGGILIFISVILFILYLVRNSKPLD